MKSKYKNKINFITAFAIVYQRGAQTKIDIIKPVSYGG